MSPRWVDLREVADDKEVRTNKLKEMGANDEIISIIDRADFLLDGMIRHIFMEFLFDVQKILEKSEESTL